MKRVRIISDGTIPTTHVTDEDGNEISVSRVSFDLKAGEGIARAELVVPTPQVAVSAAAKIRGACPYCGHEGKAPA